MLRGTSVVSGLAASTCAAMLLGSCTDAPPSALTGPRAHVAAVPLPTELLSCPSSETHSASATIGPAGGVLTAAGSSVVVPRGAVRRPVEFTLTVPESDILEIDIVATGHDRYVFERPVAVNLDYSRCASALASRGAVGVWHIDAGTRELLEYRHATRLKRHEIASFSIEHLSTYALAR